MASERNTKRLRMTAAPVPGTNHAVRTDMARFLDEEEVDIVIVGCGAGGSTLLQRLARAGWKAVALDAGPFWTPKATGSATRQVPTISPGPNLA